jgi:metal-dependent amidase/aminoacylase/carboxypeptidase family protein
MNMRFTRVIPGCFVFVNGGNADEGRPDMNHHPRFNIVQSSLAAGLKTEVIVLDVLCDGCSEPADRKGDRHLD